MSNISLAEVKRLAGLARLGLTDDELTRFRDELAAIVGYVEQLQSVEVKGVAPTDQVTGLQDVTRPDEVRPAPQSRAALLANAPATRDGYLMVKRVRHD